jgi:phosphonopyruvate decarboxylase
MNLGTLVTNADVAAKNLFHFVCENGTYEANGGHPIPGRGAVSFAGMARSAGYKSVYEFSDLKIFEQQAGAILAEQGPVFVCLKIVSSGEQERDYSRLHGPHVRKAFKDALSAN